MSENPSEPPPPEEKEKKRSGGFRAYCTIGIGWGPPKRRPQPTETPDGDAPRKPRKPWRVKLGKLAVGIVCSVAPPEDDPGPIDPLEEDEKDKDP